MINSISTISTNAMFSKNFSLPIRPAHQLEVSKGLVKT